MSTKLEIIITVIQSFNYSSYTFPILKAKYNKIHPEP